MKLILFVINTLGVGGGEEALLELLKQINSEKYAVSLFDMIKKGNILPDKLFWKILSDGGTEIRAGV